MNTCSTPNLYRVVLAHSLASAGFAVYSIVFASNPIAAAIALGAAISATLVPNPLDDCDPASPLTLDLDGDGVMEKELWI